MKLWGRGAGRLSQNTAWNRQHYQRLPHDAFGGSNSNPHVTNTWDQAWKGFLVHTKRFASIPYNSQAMLCSHTLKRMFYPLITVAKLWYRQKFTSYTQCIQWKHQRSTQWKWEVSANSIRNYDMLHIHAVCRYNGSCSIQSTPPRNDVI